MAEVLKGRLILVRIIMLAAAAGLVGIGITTIYAADNPADRPGTGQNPALTENWQKQLIFCPLALFAFIVVNAVNYRKLGPVSYWIYAAVLVLLCVLLLDKFVDIPFVPVVNSTRRWIRLKIAGHSIMQFQPSEFCKLAYILALAWYLRYRKNYLRPAALIGPFALTLLPMILILAEPDLGTVLLMMPILFVMLFIAGARVKHLLVFLLLAGCVSPLLWLAMKPYQRMRISGVLLQNNAVRQKIRQNKTITKILAADDADLKYWDKTAGYHLRHSKFAIASGGPTGYGFRHGPYLKYNFLPERHNDFIFALIAHQAGFAGSLIVLALYVIIIACGLEIAWHITEPFGRLIVIGIVAMFAVEVIVNISMTLGLMPITGLTLPLVSYGGSSLVVSSAALGLLNSVGKSRPFSVAGEPFRYK